MKRVWWWELLDCLEDRDVNGLIVGKILWSSGELSMNELNELLHFGATWRVIVKSGGD